MKYSLLIALFALLISCKKESSNIWVSYTMTQCADPWQNSPDYAKDKEDTLKKYLEAKNIEVLDLNIKLDSVCAKSVQCKACTCSSCLVASVLIRDHDLNAIEQLKFKRK